MELPLIDFSGYDEADPRSLASIGADIELALSTIGFMAVTNLDVSREQLQSVFALSRRFFSGSPEDKARSAYGSPAENFGYQALGIEHLDPGRPADLKETFTMRHLSRHNRHDRRWPDDTFRDVMTEFNEACMRSAYKVQRVFSTILDVPVDFFVQYHRGENVSIRLLCYPPVLTETVASGQLGAGAHTDYGMITLLFQDDVAGLQVNDKGRWLDVDPNRDAIVINTGDLMERWTNGRFKSTEHRVRPRHGPTPRYSVAVFVDPDSSTPVSALDSCIDDQHPVRFPQISAGAYIQSRIEASHVSKP